ncbi:MAG: hypothetical protein LBH74_09130 [Nitrososphaerota archaeon]|nr:hypothetical protein [Candidatus Termitimicrobium sp.]MCL2432188.1 hypothetical protein [Candidatus Termitimicrobium sp.]MDR0493781.1 hypothetical protein [Nitrososphaerota archaeon]
MGSWVALTGFLVAVVAAVGVGLLGVLVEYSYVGTCLEIEVAVLRLVV